MCWKNNALNKRVAEKDIPVFKVARINEDGNVVPYFYQYDKIYEEDRRYVEPCLKARQNPRMWYIERGLHSYSITNVRLALYGIKYDGIHYQLPQVQTVTKQTTPESPDKITCGQLYNAPCFVIMLCVIPKDAVYYANNVGEIVSDELTVKKIIRGSFGRLNPNGSLMRINEILDEWENRFSE